ncbi:putative zinc finger motif, C2HC5-type-domain-containing protein [Protomyces lactucae-debilis]|uniref:Putative zinc finger motif, C2HC5-type-domain-containing protein n=1 Tax=Protomyces lactucae-debilis TaxID=2754530 RepID=A0A1Y2F069_PROLT|nr:putative zinc finger motif, C2HC5-type-domain-containing protein [Protomyces lactucae-debilis]ORY77291.1 putative zinc finger motif, C2HC5-type-domain-containing protein [Protomyces lactucae-debilis]
MSNLEQWAIHHVKKLVDYLDDAEISQLVAAAMSLSTPQAVISHWSSLLGQDPAVLNFISSFNERKFPAAAAARASVPATQKQSQRPKKAVQSSKASIMTSDLGNSTASKSKEVPPKTQPKPKTRKVDALAEIDGALRELELTEHDVQTHAVITCDCQARRHPLNEVAPNCLHCGRIICNVESFTRCSFCKQPLMSRGQTQDLIAELRREKGVASAESKQQPRKVRAGTTQKMQWSSKLGANLASMDEDDLRIKAEAAEERKNALLEHVATGAKRTVIDQAADFSSTANDRWASTEERALALRRQIATLKAEEESKGARVLTLNLGGKGKPSISTAAREKRKPEEVDAGIIAAQRSIDEGKAREAQTQQALSKSLSRGDLSQVKVIHYEQTKQPKQDWALRERPVYGGGWRRVQDEDEDRERLAEELILNGRP